MSDSEIVNRVEQSGLISLDMELLMKAEDWLLFDIEPLLFQGLILKEKDFRSFIKTHDWSQYADKKVVITCSCDAIIPIWAYMLLSTKLEGLAKIVAVAKDAEDIDRAKLFSELDLLSPEDFNEAKVVVKGCSNIPNPEEAYFKIATVLLKNAKSIMYGEPCSTVPIYKQPKQL